MILDRAERELSGHIKVCAFAMFTLYPLASRIDARFRIHTEISATRRCWNAGTPEDELPKQTDPVNSARLVVIALLAMQLALLAVRASATVSLAI
jgi:hypothetical protein